MKIKIQYRYIQNNSKGVMYMTNTIVVNFFGPPGAGKSTASAYIFAKLKMAGVNAELVTEFAKDKVWEESSETFKNQIHIFGEQSFRLSRCKDKVDVILTDSPLPLSILYNQEEYLTENFNAMVMDVFNSYSNVNYFVKRVKRYNPIGRLQSEKESDELVRPLKNLLESRNIDFTEINGDVSDYDKVFENILNLIKSTKGGVIQ